MKPITLFLIVITAVAMAGCAKTPPPPQALPMPPARPTRCPFGHAALREIPVLAGCTFWQPELKQTIVCALCGYAHDPSRTSWERGSTDAVSFQVPLSDVTAHFPIIAVETRAQYYQSIEGTRCVHEGIRYISTEPAAALEPRFAAYLNDPGIIITRTPPADDNDQVTTLAADIQAGIARIQLIKPADGTKTQVTFELMPR